MKSNQLLLIAFLIISLGSCQSESSENIVDVKAKDFVFQVQDEILSGWTTFRFENQGHAEHFFLLSIVPDSISFDRYKKEVSHSFDVVLDSLNAGESKADAGALLGKMLPSWFFTEVKQMGGIGIVSPNNTAQTTLKLSPGNYIMECYIKEKGKFHSALGMVRPIKVKNDSSTMKPPKANFDIDVMNTAYQTRGEIKKGENVIAVHFKEQPQNELGNDVHIIQLNENTDIQKIIEWLDWMNVGGLESPAPITFLGGVQEMPVGNTGYFTVDLEPGSYAMIAESGAQRGLVQQFKVE